MRDPLWPTNLGEVFRLTLLDDVMPTSVNPASGEVLFGFDISGTPCIQNASGTVFCIHAAQSGQAFGFATIALLPQPAGGNSTPNLAKANNAAFGVRYITLFNFTLLQGLSIIPAGEIIVSARGSTAGTAGTIRLLNRTDNVVMADVVVPAGTTTFTILNEALVVPLSGRKVLELQMNRTAGGGFIECEAAVAEMKQEVA